MKSTLFHTAERVSAQDRSDNYVLQRSRLAYHYAAGIVHGKVLEIGTGDGYGVREIASRAEQFITVDKHRPAGGHSFLYGNVHFLQMTVPPLTTLPDNYFDFVLIFQVIEHIVRDGDCIREIERVLKPGGRVILTTPNRPMSLTRNPWHVREYTRDSLHSLMRQAFGDIELLGVHGNERVMTYYERNRAAVARIARYDVLNLQHRLPRQLLQVPYDLLNRWNRRRLLAGNAELTGSISMEDYRVDADCDSCLDLLCVARKAEAVATPAQGGTAPRKALTEAASLA